MDIIYKRLSDEEISDYIWRICSNKDNGKYNLTWDEVGEILNAECDEEYTSSKWRKNYQNEKRGYERAIEKNIDSEKQLEEIKLAKAELELESHKLRYIKLGMNEQVRERAKKETILDDVKFAISNLKPIEPPKFIPIEKGSKFGIFGVADAHFGKEFSIEGFKGDTINMYSEEIFYRRMEELLSEYIDIVKDYKLQSVKFFDLSDNVEGVLRYSALQSIKYGTTEASIKYAHYLISWLNRLSQYVEIDYYDCRGNHNEYRILNSKSGDFAKENSQYIINEMLKLGLSNNNRVNVNSTRAIQFVETENYNILAVHGQDERGLVDSVINYKEIYDVKVDLMISGHLHNSKQETASLHTKVVQFPSLVGIDDFSMKLKKTSKAEGKAIIIDGKKFINIDIDLQ